MRGYARVRGDAQLQSAWADAAGATIARQTRAMAIRRGVLHVAVDHAPLLSELAGFYRQSLLEKMQELHAAPEHPRLEVQARQRRCGAQAAADHVERTRWLMATSLRAAAC